MDLVATERLFVKRGDSYIRIALYWWEFNDCYDEEWCPFLGWPYEMPRVDDDAL